MRRDAFLAALLMLTACGGGGGLTEDTPGEVCGGKALVDPALPETLTGDHYLSAEVGTYTVATSLYLASGTLCVEPGVTVALAKGGSIVVGSDQEAALVAVGRRADGTSAPIRFTSADRTPHIGDWDKIHFTPRNLGDVSVLDNVVVEYAGAYDTHGRANVTVEGTSVTLRDVTLRKGLGLGLYFEGSDAFPRAFERIAFESLADGALELELRHLPRLSGGATVGSGVDHATLRGGSLYESATLPAWGLPWVMGGDNVTVQNGAVLTVEAGVELRLGPGVRLTGGGETVGGFALEGTAEAPVVLTSAALAPAPGDWDKLVITPLTKPAVLRHVVLRDAGRFETSGGKAALLIGGPVDDVTDVRIEDCAGHGVWVQEAAPQPTHLEGLVIASSGLPALNVAPKHLGLLAADVTLPEGGSVTVRAGDLATAVDLSAEPHHAKIEGKVALVDGGTLALGPGTTWAFAQGAGLWVGEDPAHAATLVAEGAADAPVTFSSAAATPAAGDWDKLLLGPGCQGRGCTLAHVAIAFGGGGDVPAPADLAVVDCDATLTNVTLDDSAGWGLWVSSDATPTMTAVTGTRNAQGFQGP